MEDTIQGISGVFSVQHFCDYILFNDGCGYGVLEHMSGYLGTYVLWYYYKLEVAYNKYYLKHTTTISHKLPFVMAESDPISGMVEKRVKEDSMEARLWAQRLEDLLESYVVKDVVKEAMTLVGVVQQKAQTCIWEEPPRHYKLPFSK